MKGLCFWNKKGIYSFESNTATVKLNKLTENSINIGEIPVATYDYEIYRGEIVRVTKEIKDYITDENILKMIDIYA